MYFNGYYWKMWLIPQHPGHNSQFALTVGFYRLYFWIYQVFTWKSQKVAYDFYLLFPRMSWKLFSCHNKQSCQITGSVTHLCIFINSRSSNNDTLLHSYCNHVCSYFRNQRSSYRILNSMYVSADIRKLTFTTEQMSIDKWHLRIG